MMSGSSVSKKSHSHDIFDNLFGASHLPTTTSFILVAIVLLYGLNIPKLQQLDEMAYKRTTNSWTGVGKSVWEHTYSVSSSSLPSLSSIPRPNLSTWLDCAYVFSMFIISLYLLGKMVQAVVSYMNKKPVYLMAYSTYKPPAEWQVSTDRFLNHAKEAFNFTDDAIAFSQKIMSNSGLGEKTAFPPGILAAKPDISMPMARLEAEYVLFGILDDLFATTAVKPKQIDILVVNCSLFCPTPSLSAMIINKYKMREDIQSYNLSGMGCSAGVISINLAKDLLQVYKNATALVVSTENITQNIYLGQERGMQISNTLFRVGGAAMMLSNRKHFRPSRSAAPVQAKYELERVVRTHMGADDDCYKCVWQDADQQGCIGVRLNKDLMNVAGRALKRNITRLAPHILPWSEQLRFAWREVRRFAQRTINKKGTYTPLEAYTPDFTKAVDHFCIHAGGRGVIDAVQKNLSLSDEAVAPSRHALYTMGNTSSSSIWYEFEYIEKNRSVKSGEKIWQIAFGSGFKCNSAIWRAL